MNLKETMYCLDKGLKVQRNHWHNNLYVVKKGEFVECYEKQLSGQFELILTIDLKTFKEVFKRSSFVLFPYDFEKEDAKKKIKEDKKKIIEAIKEFASKEWDVLVNEDEVTITDYDGFVMPRVVISLEDNSAKIKPLVRYYSSKEEPWDEDSWDLMDGDDLDSINIAFNKAKALCKDITKIIHTMTCDKH